MNTFQYWQSCFGRQEMTAFNGDRSGVVWLKLKSIIRKNILKEFAAHLNRRLPVKNDTAFASLYDLYVSGELSESDLDTFINKYNSLEIEDISGKFNKIETDLYRVENFAWGGDATNSLDKRIVDYVKKTASYDDICRLLENDIYRHTVNYTIASWYNNWSAILTEHLFKKHPKVISAPGKTKSVDFFIDGIPMDLKITYLPKGYIAQVRKEKGLNSEEAALRKFAKEHAISYNAHSDASSLRYQISEKVKDSDDVSLQAAFQDFRTRSIELIKSSLQDKASLIKWLYENQGEMRFGSENRLFLVLVDVNDIQSSWKLKRNFRKLTTPINQYLDEFDAHAFRKNVINFEYKRKNYQALADIIYITSEDK